MNIHLPARLILLAGLAAAITGCNTPDFPKYDKLGDLRILTVIASAPETNPGDVVTFTPVLSDINGQGRAINYSVQACIDPGVGIGVEPLCNNPDPTSIQSGTVTVPPGDSRTYTGPVSSFTLAMPAAETIFAGRSDREQYNGIAYLVFYSISVPDGPSVNSFLRVFVTSSAKASKNQNPEITSIDLNDSPVTGIIAMPATASDFRVTSPAASAETFQVVQNDGSLKTRTEELINTWFISDGTLDFMRTLGNTENSWTPPDSKPSARGMIILIVTRDGRGGAAFQKIEMN